MVASRLLNERWNRGRVKDLVSSCINGVWGTEPSGESAGVPTVRAADFDWSRLIVRSTVPIRRNLEAGQIERVGLRYGDIVLEKSGGGERHPVGRAVRYTGDSQAVPSNFAARLRPARDVDARYLCYSLAALYWSGANLKYINQTTGIQNLDSKRYLAEPWVFPNFLGQQTIADFLDYEEGHISTLIDLKSRLVNLLEERRQAAISTVVGGGEKNGPYDHAALTEWFPKVPKDWRVGPLKRLVVKIGSGKTPRGGAERYVPEGVAFIRSQNIRNEGLSLEDVVYIDSDTDAEMSTTRLQDGDVLLNITGASLGRVGVFDLGMTANVSQHVAILRPRPSVHAKWLAFALSSRPLQEQIWATQTGAAREGLPNEVTGRLILAIPQFEDQSKIVDSLIKTTRKTDRALQILKDQVSLLSEYRQALITKAVTGQLDEATLRGHKAVEETLGAMPA